jgi:hypothetical protein
MSQSIAASGERCTLLPMGTHPGFLGEWNAAAQSWAPVPAGGADLPENDSARRRRKRFGGCAQSQSASKRRLSRESFGVLAQRIPAHGEVRPQMDS